MSKKEDEERTSLVPMGNMPFPDMTVSVNETFTPGGLHSTRLGDQYQMQLQQISLCPVL